MKIAEMKNEVLFSIKKKHLERKLKKLQKTDPELHAALQIIYITTIK